MIAALPLNELKAYINEKTETREYFKVVVTAIRIHTPVIVVSIHSLYLLCLLLLLLILCAYFCVISCDECFTPSHRKW